MPTTIANPRVAFDRISGRWSDFHDAEKVEEGRGHALLFAAIVATAVVICAICLASGLHPAPVNSTEFAILLGA